MLISRIGKCNDCVSIDSILEQIDCVLSTYAKDQIDNNHYELNKPIPAERIQKIIRYKSILLKRRFNPYYIWRIPNADIISRVKTLLN